MIARTRLHQRSLCHRDCESSQRFYHIEPLEGRTLLSFTTVDLVPGGINDRGVTADGHGNVYVAAEDDNGSYLREGSNGGTTWTNILTVPDPTGLGAEIEGIGASPTGDVYVALSNSTVMERPAGATQFSQVLQAFGAGPGQIFSADAAGNLYFTAEYGSGSQIWRRQGGSGAFAVVDTTPALRGTAIYATAQGVYEVGYQNVSVNRKTSAWHWMVRKSATGDPNTWSTVDDFVLDAADNLTSSAWAVTVDARGNVLVGGQGLKQERVGGKSTTLWYALVRESSDGGKTWTTDTIDSAPQLNGLAQVTGLGTDAAGNAYAAEKKSAGGVSTSIVNMKPAGGTGWTVVDNFGPNATAYGLTVDSNNNLYVVGYGSGGASVRSMPGAPAPSLAAARSAALSPAPSAGTPGSEVQVCAPHTHGIGEASADWWQWALAFSNDQPNPFTDPTGDLAGLNQSGHVFFMPGVAGPGTFTRTVQVPAGQPVLVPLVVTELSTLEGAGDTPKEVRSADAAFADLIDSLNVTIDGAVVPDLFAHREVSPTFHFVAAHNNPIGDPEDDSGIAEADGYWLMLAPMAAGGTHVIHSTGGVSSFGVTFDVTTTFTVTGKTPPGHAALPMVSAAAAVPAGADSSIALVSDDDLKKGHSGNTASLLV